jgi:hypothetical protein
MGLKVSIQKTVLQLQTTIGTIIFCSLNRILIKTKNIVIDKGTFVRIEPVGHIEERS